MYSINFIIFQFVHCARVFVPKVSVAHCFRHLSGRSFGTLLLSIRCISRPIRRRYRFGRRPRAHISQGCARCKESGPDRLGHSPASGPVAPGRTRVGARPPSCGAAVRQLMPPPSSVARYTSPCAYLCRAPASRLGLQGHRAGSAR